MQGPRFQPPSSSRSSTTGRIRSARDRPWPRPGGITPPPSRWVFRSCSVATARPANLLIRSRRIDLEYGTSQLIARMQGPRAEATASVLSDGSILLVGGMGATGAPLADAELFNPITRSTTAYSLAFARRGHSATVLPDGRVMIAGGFDATGSPISEVELFAVGRRVRQRAARWAARAPATWRCRCAIRPCCSSVGARARSSTRAPRIERYVLKPYFSSL